MKLHSSIFVIFIFFIIGCASTPVQESSGQKAPEWITAGVNSVYNENKYLASDGDGTTANLARHDALNKLSQYFEAKVRAEGIAHRTSINSFFSSSVEQTISVKSNADLFCVEYDQFYDEIQNRYYCVAFINREQAFNFVKPKLEIARTQFPPAYHMALENDSLLDRIIGIKRAQGVLPDFYEVYDFARAILPEKTKPYEAVDFLVQESLLNLKTIAASILIKIEGTGDTDLLEKSGVVAELSNQFKEMGFVVGKSSRSNCIAQVEVKSIITETQTTFETYPEISIRIIEKGVEKISYNKKLKKVAGFDKDTVVRRTNDKLTEEIRTSFVKECF